MAFPYFDTQSLITTGKIVDLTQINTSNAYVTIGYWQPGNRKNGEGINAYPSYVLTIADLLAGASSTGVQSVTVDNGLTISNVDPVNPNIQLGGTLLQDTTIANGGFNFYITGTGKVGINTITPAYTLEVNGDVNIESTANVYRIGAFDAVKMSQGAGAANIGLGNLTVLNDANNGGAIAIGSQSEATSEGIAIGLLSKTDVTTVDSIAIGREAMVTAGSVRGIAIGRWARVISGNNTMSIGFFSSATQANSIILGNTDTVNFPTAPIPNVGIATGAPTARLHVVGLNEYADNAAAIAAGHTVGAFYRTGDILKVVH